MLKTAKYRYITLACARLWLLFFVLLAAMPAQGQVGQFTLTDGTFKWFEGPTEATCQEAPALFRRIFDDEGNETRIEVHNYDPDHVQLNLYMGPHYLRLDTSSLQLQSVDTGDNNSGFDQFCVWTLDGYPGYYYQEWYDTCRRTTYRYYIVGASARSPKLEVVRYEVGQPLLRTTKWSTWDFGAALTESGYRNGRLVSEYYWITREGSAWTLSCNTYQRPEDGVWYYDRFRGGWQTSFFCPANTDTNEAGFLQPAGNGALQMAVTKVDSGTVIVSRAANVGLTNVTLYENHTYNESTHTITFSDPSADNTMGNGSVLYLEYTLQTGNALVTPPFRKYVLDRKRRGMNSDYKDRKGDIFGKNGVPTKDSVYYYDPNFFVSGDVSHVWTKQSSRPGNGNQALALDTLYFELDRPSQRYIELDLSDTHTVEDVFTHALVDVPVVTLRMRTIPPMGGEAYLSTIARYTNGSADTILTTIHYDGTLVHVDRDPVAGPVIRGSLFGGGRMANVGYDAGINNVSNITGGSTSITVHNADSIYALYGGNDIAGWVQGHSTIQIGTEYTNKNHPVNIAYVYGGGCGYYSYDNMYDAVGGSWGDTLVAGGLPYGTYCFNGQVYPWGTTSSTASSTTPVVDHTFDYIPFTSTDPSLSFALCEKGQTGDGTVPYIKSSHITVGVPEDPDHPFIIDGVTVDPANRKLTDSTRYHNDYIFIDSLFGGAENAFIGVSAAGSPANGVTIDINGGTIYSVFGGNNYGGSVAATSTVYVDVYDTKLGTEEDVEHEDTYYTGYGRDFGIRYLFGGGNKVDGSHAEVNIYGGMLDTVFLGGNNATVDFPTGTVECLRHGADTSHLGDKGHFIWTNMTVDTANAVNTDLDEWETETGRYNVKALFGGNNLAAMNTPAFIQLHSGGISCVYGGGNAGDMNNDADLTSSFPEIYRTLLAKAFQGSEMKVPTKIGAIVSALNTSQIVCDYVFGGCRMANVKNSCGMYLAGGVFGYVNGGNDVSGDVGSETGGGTYVVLDSSVVVVADVTAGSDGYYHCPDKVNGTQYYDDRELFDTYTYVSYDPYDEFVGYLRPTHNSTNLYIRNGTVLGKATAGGVAADVGFNVTGKIDRGGNKAKPDDDVDLTVDLNSGEAHFTMRGGTVMGDCFGGGYSSSVYGLSYIHISDSARIEGSLFAGNDCTGSIESWAPYRNTDGTVAVDKAASDGTPLNKLKDGSLTEYENAFSSYVLIDGTPYVHALYGSGNGAYDYDGSRPQYEWTSTCDWEDRMPIQKSAFLDIHTSSGAKIDSVFGGGNGVSVRDNVVILLNCESSTDVRGEIDTNDVDAIFGGNNLDDMADCVPEIRLKKGIVGDVYGGSNNGNNTGVTDRITDACGNVLPTVSTYVLVENPDVTITGSVYGGCNSGNVDSMAYVRVSNTTENGVEYVYGGNNVSGTVQGNTLVEVTGGVVKNIYGGSNGHYDYVEVGNNDYVVYEYGTSGAPSEGDTIMMHSPGRPDVDSTTVRIYGGKITNNVFGGGRMGDCRATSVVVDDRTCGRPEEGLIAADTGAVILGTIFGGGEGYWENLNNERRGNVTDATHVDLYHAKKLASAKAYGGGKGGDVYSTFITAHESWDKPFEALYGGSWGSNVHGIAHVIMNSDPSHLRSGEYSADELFGGNDFTGNVYKSEITINSGKYNNIYGGSDGDYETSDYTSGVYASNHLRRPNSQYVEITFNDGTVENNLYGGGKRGTSFCFVKNSNGEDIVDGSGHKTPDTTLTYDASHSNPLDYSYIITNIHNGTFKNSIFAGARGAETDERPLVYGLKVLNMDGGHVYESIYGGSENADDGYPAECKTEDDWDYVNYSYYENGLTESWSSFQSSNKSTRRPSSIINLTGGTVENNVYGAGYLGDVHGSTFVNIGQDAIDSCEAFTMKFPFHGGVAGAYGIFKPGASEGLVPALGKSDLLLNKSVYAGANWGNSSEGNASFTDEGYHGGISSVKVDGKGYNTDNDVLNLMPTMNVAKSLFGSGTSVMAGDLRSDLAVRNYGSMANCHPTKNLESIQRFDTVMLHKDAIHFTGAVDAASANFSEPYTWLSNNRMALRGYNVMEFDAPSVGTQHLYVYEEEPNAQGALQLVPVQTLHQVVDTAHVNACGADVDICTQEYVVDPTTAGKQHTLLILNNGIDFTLAYKYYTSYYYGKIYGYSYFAAPSGSGPTVSADRNNSDDNLSWDKGMSGFVLTCRDTNMYTADNTANEIAWVKYGQDGAVNNKTEFPYRNTQDLNTFPYREWSLPGYRSREVSILAHHDPSKLDNNASAVINGEKVGLADVVLTLPAAAAGHYYLLDNSSIILESENDVLNLVDSTWASTKDMSSLNGNATDKGEWHKVYPRESSVAKTGLGEIRQSPSNTFGLVLYPNFSNESTTGGFKYNTTTKKYIMPDGMESRDTSLVLSGNSYVNSVDYYCSPQVAAGEGGSRVMPTMRLMLTYDTTFYTTFVGSVSFILNECVRTTRGTDSVIVPIHVKVNIATVIDEFNPVTTNVLAMYNAGRTNTFNRKISLPATLDKNRELYIKSAYWVPTTIDGEDTKDSTRFYLTDNDAAITGADEGVNNRFCLRVIPSENLTSNNSSNIGWSHVYSDTVNIRTLKDNNHDTVRFSALKSDGAEPPTYTVDSIYLHNASSKGLHVGTLDGRGMAVLNFELTFDGARKYPDTKGLGYVGKVVLMMESFQGNVSKGVFPITVYVKTRENGDTIYIASASSVVRDSKTLKPYTQNATYTALVADNTTASLAKAAAMVGKSPNAYVQSFQQALSSKVYQEGDVVCVLDTVKVKGGAALTIHGGDGQPIEVIRYEGHHHEMPGENGVYRYGPMILVQNEGSHFTAHNIAFHGSAGAINIKNLSTGEKDPDTNIVFAPIIAAVDSATVTLATGTTVMHNWNGYGSKSNQLEGGLPKYSRNMGAISVVNGATLDLQNNVTIARNFSHTFDGDKPGDVAYDANRPYNGAVYVDGGKVELLESKSGTAIDISENLLMNPGIHAVPPTACWWDTVTMGSESRYRFVESKVAGWQKANVFLTRKASATAPVDLNDSQSDYIAVAGAQSDNSKIGVRKWFPGFDPLIRDTIRIVRNTSSNPAILSTVYDKELFVSDDDQNVFYSAKVNGNFIYLQRCATFRHQIASDLLATGAAAGDVLDYQPNLNVSCPTGGDRIIYRVQGGFFPYQYTWKETTAGDGDDTILLRDVSTLYNNSTVTADLKAGDNTSYLISVADTFITMGLAVADGAGTVHKGYVVATDEAGCQLQKNFQATFKMYDPSTDGDFVAFTKTTSPDNGWTDTNWTTPGNRKTADGTRLFRGVHITPKVWADRSQGTIRAQIYYDGTPKDTVIYTTDATDANRSLEHQRLCEGDVIKLYTKPKSTPSTEGAKFIMWDFDPYYTNPARYVVPNEDDDVVAYYGPANYWKDHVTNETQATAANTTSYYYSRPDGKGYVTAYNGDVHIYNEQGLAWLISVVNGLNGQQARPFRFNTIYIHQKDGGYDMKDYLWSPVGTSQHKFRGRFVGVGSVDTDTTALTGDSRVVIKNIIINEPNMNNVAFFANLETAEVESIELQGVLARGSQYVGGLASRSTNSEYDNVAVTTNVEAQTTTSILTTRYVSGGLIAESNGDKVNNSKSWVKYVGDAVYSGGVVGYGTSTTIENDGPIRNDVRMSGLYLGGVAGYLDGTAPYTPRGLARLFKGRKAANYSMVANNYVEVINKGLPQNVGGLVGYAQNTVLENNYVFGNVEGSNASGAVAAVMSDNANADKNYYAYGSTKNEAGFVEGNATLTNTSSFEGSGNQVMLANRVYGIDNLTRVLNKYVREKNAEGGHYRTWRSDLEEVNSGYPLFGEPDMIPVVANTVTDGCEEVTLNGVTYYHDTVVSYTVVDYDEMVDSTVTAAIRLHYGARTLLSDTALLERGYSRHGFSISSDELSDFAASFGRDGYATLVLQDTLTTVYGCDSIVTLTLSFKTTPVGVVEVESVNTVSVYPNPTINVLHVEADRMSHVEVYDNEGRRLQNYDAYGSNRITIDMTPYVTGIYFVRIHTPESVVIQKVIKER